MRSRWRQERDRSDAMLIDLKQGAGTLLDIEFLSQGLVLAHAATITTAQAIPSSTPALLAWLVEADVLSADDAERLERAQPRRGEIARDAAERARFGARLWLAAREAELNDAAKHVLSVAASAGFVFS